MKPGRAGTMTHDYKRNGTTTLFAALDVLDGAVIGQCLPRHRHQEFLKFLRTIDREVPGEPRAPPDPRQLLDPQARQRQGVARQAPALPPPLHPDPSSWLNLVERWFRELTDKAIRRGVFHSVPDLIAAIEAYLDAHNDNPKPFIWTATADQILDKVSRCKAVLETVH